MPPRLSSKTRTIDRPSSGQLNENTALVIKSSFTPPPSVTYAASAVNNVTHRRVLLARLEAAPRRVITVPEIERLSFDSSAQSASLRTCSKNQSRAPHEGQFQRPGAVKVSHNFQNCLPVPLRWVVRVVRLSTNGVRDVRFRHRRQLHQAAHSLPVRPVLRSSAGRSSKPGVEDMSEDDLTTRRFNMLSTNAFPRDLQRPQNSQSRSKVQPVYQDSSPSTFVGIFVFSAACEFPCVFRPILRSRWHLHEFP